MKRTQVSPPDEDALWNELIRWQAHTFHTAKGLAYTYAIRGNEMFVSRKEKSITRATVNMAYRRALELQRDGGLVAGPKKLGTFGASYLYPVFVQMGVVLPPKAEGEESKTCIFDAEML